MGPERAAANPVPQQPLPEQTVARRSVLKGLGVGAVAAGAGGVLSACGSGINANSNARMGNAPNPMSRSGRRPQLLACRPTQGAIAATTICGRTINADTMRDERLSP